MTRWLGVAVATIAFAALATANSGGYRFGVSDQAFYEPAVVKNLHPSFYPRDAELINAQARLMLSDKIVAGLARWLGVDLPPLFLAIYCLTLVALALAAMAFARASGFSWWTAGALLLLLTFRHRIAKTGANSLEGYMHPRELAFALGVAALAAILSGRHMLALLSTGLAAVLHPTTAFWFAIVLAVAVWVARPSWRRGLAGAGALIAAIGVWAVLFGPLTGRLVKMDAAWLSVLADKDYLFPTGWPAYAWLANLAYPVIIGLVYRRRVTLGVARPGEWALIVGMGVLTVVFALSAPLSAMGLALAVQMQVTRVFWLLDFVTAAYLAWLLTSGLSRSARPVRVTAVALLAVLSIARGYYLLEVAQPDRRFLSVSLPPTPWVDAMTWLKARPSSWHVLADPGHAWKYGVSVRVAAEKDTLLEAGKDAAVAIYDRDVAMRVFRRSRALNGFDRLTTADMRALAARYALDVAVVETTQRLDLPELYRNWRFVIYDLR